MCQALLSLILLMGCELTDSSGDLLQPVSVESADVAVDEPVEEPDQEEEKTGLSFDDDADFVISSEELHAQAEALRRGESLDAPDGSAAQANATAPASTGQYEMAAATTGIAVASHVTAPGGWPLRLVSTTPQANPPRAILGLPDGREVVVSPGSMVPDAGVVVMAVGTGNLQLARVTANGDHAAVHTQTLSAQY